MSVTATTSMDEPALRALSEGERALIAEQYKLYVEMTDRSHTRRDAANGFFVTLHTAVLGATGLMADKLDTPRVKFLVVTLLAVGALLSFAWWLRLKSFRQLHEGKFRVIHDLEQQLPAKPYDDEWRHLGEGRDSRRYRPLTVTEALVPWTFLVAYAVAATLVLRAG